ncbi:MAG: SGNH/GDSL hydrolase family protein, partial [Clostridia bacterium]|nr:SGNH/GDSL hydrolase family protein [Clostridia bacterium]
MSCYDGTTRHFRVECYEENQSVVIKVWVDGVLEIDYTDSTDPILGAGSIQFGNYACTMVLSDGVKLDRLLVTDRTLWGGPSTNDIQFGDDFFLLPQKNGWNYAHATRGDIGNYTASFTMQVVSNAPADATAYFVVKAVEPVGTDELFNGTPNTYRFIFVNNHIALLKNNEIVIRNVNAFQPGFSPTDGNEHDIVVESYEQNGNTHIRLFYDGVLEIDYVDSSSPVLGKGIIQFGNVGCHLRVSEDVNTNVNPDAIKVLILGNSITLHAPSPSIGWMGNWGMAASSEDKDYVHQLMGWAKEKNSNVEYRAVNIAEWERAFSTYNISTLASYRNYDADIIIMRVAENVTASELQSRSFRLFYKHLIDYFNKSGDAKVICTTNFGYRDEVDAEIAEVAHKYGYPLISLGALGEDDSNKALGLFEDPGVASHPGDKGMLEIAKAIWPSLEDILDGGDGHITFYRRDPATNISIETAKDVVPADTILSVTPIATGASFDAAAAALPGYKLHQVVDVALMQGNTTLPVDFDVSLVIPRPRYTMYRELEIYSLVGGKLTLLGTAMDDEAFLTIETDYLGQFIIAEKVDPENIYADDIVDETEIDQLISISPAGKVVIGHDDMEIITITPNAFANIRDTKRPVELQFRKGKMVIPAKVFAAISERFEDLTFTLSPLDDAGVQEVKALATQRQLTLYGNIFYEVAVQREHCLSLSLPIEVTLYESVATAPRLSMLCIEEDNYVSEAEANVQAQSLAFDAKNFHFYTLYQASESGDTLNPDIEGPGDEDTQPDDSSPATGYPDLLGISLCLALIAGCVVILTFKKRNIIKKGGNRLW